METQETMDRVSQVHILLPAAKRAVKKKLMSTPLKTKSVVRRGSVRQDAQNKSILPYFTNFQAADGLQSFSDNAFSQVQFQGK